MKLRSQVCSLELSKRLKEFGVKQESLFEWIFYTKLPTDKKHEEVINIIKKEWHIMYKQHLVIHQLLEIVGEGKVEYESISAFTVAELGEMLPSCLGDITKDNHYDLFLMNDCDHWFTQYWDCSRRKIFKDTENESLANSIAKMLIWLIENKHLEIKK